MITRIAYYDTFYHCNIMDIFDFVEFDAVDYSTMQTTLRSLWHNNIQVAFEYFKR